MEHRIADKQPVNAFVSLAQLYHTMLCLCLSVLQDHPVTLGAMQELALTLWQLGMEGQSKSVISVEV